MDLKMQVFDIILGPFQKIENFIKPFMETYSTTMDGIKAIKKGWATLKEG